MPAGVEGRSSDNACVTPVRSNNPFSLEKLNRKGKSSGVPWWQPLDPLFADGLRFRCGYHWQDPLPEDLDEYLYHIDRMMMNLKRNGKLAGLKGLIVGGMTEMKDNPTPAGRTAEEIIAEAVAEYDYRSCTVSRPATSPTTTRSSWSGGHAQRDGKMELTFQA